MSDLTVERPAGDGCVRTRTLLTRARRETMRLVGEAALLLAAASSATALVAGSAHAPSAGFVAECCALGIAALYAARLRALRPAAPALALVATATLLLVLVLEVLRSGASAIALAGGVALLPVLAIQVAHPRQRTLAVAATVLVLVLGALGAGLERAQLVPLAAGLSAAGGIVLTGVRGLDRTRARRARRRSDRPRTAEAARPLLGDADETIANLSHDLRNPLAIAVGFAEMVADADLAADERAQALAGVRRTLWEISQLVENVLDGSADRAGALQPCCEPLAVEALCRESLAAMQVLLRGRPIVLVGSVEPGLKVVADRHGLGRVLGNLLGNAAKFTERGEIRLIAASRRDQAVILVSDTGPGIAPEAVPFIFDRFRRAHGGGRGAGLGLAIARRLTERMGGSLEVETTLGAGSTFTITLPRVSRTAASGPTHVAA